MLQMRILLWSPYGAGTHYWGPGTSAFRLYKRNRNTSIKVTLIHASEDQGLFPEVYDEQIKLPIIKGAGLLSRIRYQIAASIWISKNYKRYDVVHGLTAFDYTFRPLIKLTELGVPSIIKITGENGGFGNNGFLSKLIGIAKWRKKNANTITGYLAISRAIAENLLLHGVENKKIFEIPNGVDTMRFKKISKTHKIELRKKLNIRDTFTLIYVGGLTFNKRVIETVEALKLLLDKGYDIQYLIVGPDRSEGLVEKKITQLIVEHGLQNSIKRFPHTESPELYYQVSDAFVLNSEKEGMSNSLLEAMASGLICFVTPISGSVDLIRNEQNGIFIDGSSEDFYNKIVELWDNLKLQAKIKRNVVSSIEKEYSTDKILERHIGIFQSVIKCE